MTRLDRSMGRVERRKCDVLVRGESSKWSDVPGTVGFEETVLLKGSNAGCKTRLRTNFLPSVNVLLLPPFCFLVPTFLPAFFAMWGTQLTL